MADLRLSLGVGNYAHTNELTSGAIRPNGIELTSIVSPIEPILFRFAKHLEFDVAEFSLGMHVAQTAGDAVPPAVALPVFTSRVFRHSSIYIRDGAGIATAADLAGKRIGIPQWSQTATIYVRGWMQHDIGIDLSSIAWIQAGVNEAGRIEPSKMTLPDRIVVTPRPDASLSDMLVAGDIDAMISARPPDCFNHGVRGIGRLFPDFRAEEERYFDATGIFPIMHVVAIKRDTYEKNPWIARNLFDAFEAAKRASVERLSDIQVSTVPSAWASEEFKSVNARLFGPGKFWEYGIDANRTTLEAFLTYCYEQGVAKRIVPVDELFAPEVRVSHKV